MAEYGNVQSIMQAGEYNEYAAYEKNYTKADGKQYFLPRGSSYIQTGYVSESISDADGFFDQNPIITFSMESAYTFYNMNFLFGTVWPEEFVIRTYNNGEKTGTFRSKNVKQKTVVNYTFVDVDKIEVEFTRAAPFNRLHLKRVEFGEATDYEITYDDMTSTPEGTKLEKVKEVRVVRTIYTKGTDLKDLTSDEVTIPAAVCEYDFTFNNPVHDLNVSTIINDEAVDYGAIIVESGSYYCRIRIAKPPSVPTTATITISGYEYEITTAMSTTKLNNNGSIKTWDNPLISSEQDAANLVEWVGEYYAGENEYKINYRGDPVLDGNDLVYLESLVVKDLMVRLEEVNLKYSGSLSGNLKARRVD